MEVFKRQWASSPGVRDPTRRGGPSLPAHLWPGKKHRRGWAAVGHLQHQSALSARAAKAVPREQWPSAPQICCEATRVGLPVCRLHPAVIKGSHRLLLTRTFFQKMGRWTPIDPQQTPSHARLRDHGPYDLKCFTPVEGFYLEAPRALFGWQLNCSGLSQLHCCWAELSALGDRFAPPKLSCILAQNCWKMEQEGELPGGIQGPQPQGRSGCRTAEKHPNIFK